MNAHERAALACATCGLTVEDARRRSSPARPARAAAARIDRALGARGVALLTGPSGAGKTSILNALGTRGRACAELVLRPDPRTLPRAPVIGLFPGPVARALRLLARAGLADGALPALRTHELSEGQRWRLALAVAMGRAERARRPVLLLVDEFGSSLDAEAAAGVAASLGKWAQSTGFPAGPGESAARGGGAIRVVAATTRTALVGVLAPDLVVRVIPGAGCTVERRRRRTPRALPLRIARGTIADFGRLAPLHYRAGRPATRELVLTATTGAGTLAGVLVVSRPTLNGPWRELAWPGRYRTGSARADAARLNRELRTISRVIVDPRFRSRAVATRLVRAYLRRPLTPATEAVAAMGACSPFFRAAGMTEYRLGPTARAARLADALAAAGVSPLRLLREGARACGPLLRRELRVWANGAGATRGLLRQRARRTDIPAEPVMSVARVTARLARAAGLALCTRRVAYAHVRGGEW